VKDDEKKEGTKEEDEGVMNIDPDDSNDKLTEMQLENEDDLLYEEKLQRREECLGAKRSNSTDSFVLKFQKELSAYEEMYVSNRVDSRTSVLDFWEEKMTTFPLLYELSSIVLAAPGTQVLVERLFSSLKLILSDLRERLGSSNAQNILLVRNNFELLDDKFFAKEALH